MLENKKVANRFHNLIVTDYYRLLLVVNLPNHLNFRTFRCLRLWSAEFLMLALADWLG